MNVDPLMPSGHIHPLYQLAVHFRFEGCLVYFFIFIVFRIEIPVSK